MGFSPVGDPTAKIGHPVSHVDVDLEVGRQGIFAQLGLNRLCEGLIARPAVQG